MRERVIPVAAVQTQAHDRAAFAHHWPTLRAALTAAAEAGAKLIVAPEGTVPGYVLGSDPVDPDQIEAAARDVIAIAAQNGATIVYGTARPDERGTANSAYVATGDGIVGFADKCFLWHFDRRWFRESDRLAPVDTPAGKLGIFICADGRIPTIAATLVAQGAELLVVPTAWVTSGRDPQALENIQADVMAPVRARENGVPLIAANKCGVERRSVLYCGKSQIVAASGEVLAFAPQDAPTILHANVEVVPPPVRAAEPAAVQRGSGGPLPAALRIAIAARAERELHILAATADAGLTLDPQTGPESAEIALCADDAITDPRALVAPRLAGVRLFVWRATAIEDRWLIPFARTRAAELRAYLVALDLRHERAYAIDPDGAILCSTFGDFALGAFAFARERTDAWRVAPATDVRDGLVRVSQLALQPH
ncbi:MAG: carbon-nitrogen hydrolase family protein [Candidatus Eremiobacteraeota bacterium]|nr:carbon-nitrogen hydrolase family protein [Candidatus Eremiobacteraeota bacterium]